MKIQKMKFVQFSLALLLLFASCSSPESDGANLAQEYCDNVDSYIANTVKAYNNFVKEFSDNDFQTRAQAREALNNRLEKIVNDFTTQNEKIDDRYSDLLAKYEDDHKKSTALILAYNNGINNYSVDTTMIAGLRAQANKKILTIIPPQPSTDKLRDDLVGRKLHALPGGYFSNSWVWTIEKGEIKDLQINDINNVDAQNKEYIIDMTLQAEGAAYKAKAKVFYNLADKDDWEIDMVEPAEINIVKTGRYDNSIISKASQQFLGTYLKLQNISDGALLVGYQILDSQGHWTKYSRIVSGGETSSHAVLGYMDHKIDFVERP